MFHQSVSTSRAVDPRTAAHRDPDRPIRIAHVVSHPIQYFAPLYRALDARPEVDVTVYFLSDSSLRRHYDPGFGKHFDWDVDLATGYRYRLVSGAVGREPGRGIFQRPRWEVLRELLSNDYDVFWLHGYNDASIALAAALGRATGRRVMIREEQTLLEPRPLLKRAVKEAALRLLFSGVDGLYLGQASKEFFRHFGVPESRLFRVPYCADTPYLDARATELAPQRATIRRRLGIDDNEPAILFAGKLVQRKTPESVLAAFQQVRERQRCWLVFAGDGQQRAALEEQVRRSQTPNVVILGFVNQTGLPEVYAAADIFVLPSLFNETWGVVVNEAMAFGLPVIVSDHVGCAGDLVRSGWNGFVTPAGDVRQLSDAFRTVVENEVLRRRFGDNSRSLIRNYSVDASADALVLAARADAGCAQA